MGDKAEKNEGIFEREEHVRSYHRAMGSKKGLSEESADMGSLSSNLMVGDAGVEPTTFGSGDQRSIHLS